MVVRQVLDVSTGTVLEEHASVQGMELALVKQKVTMVHRDSDAKPKAAWQEVA
jgi:two-component system, chemotaxis family, sensor kinase CheA